MSTSYKLNELESIREENENTDKPLLRIELENETAVPKVFYKGEEVRYKRNIMFEWDTSDARSLGGLTYAIETVVTGEGHLVTNRLERKVGDHC